ncbi:unnamed protein product [Cuscuta epithymum]|uniref:Uncharacterized protein n=1 Tax=Cuscuta epithymum TaxID=186058 RepID=A0AAV0D846_9ASTE|nr:unnamed protein product [Cuscuta epithymum]
MRDSINPICLDYIDMANEWLTGEVDDANEELVFADGDDLTWGDVAKFSGVHDTPYSLRRNSKGKDKAESSKSKGKEKASTRRLVDEDEDEDEEDAGVYDDDSEDFDTLLMDEEEQDQFDDEDDELME